MARKKANVEKISELEPLIPKTATQDFYLTSIKNSELVLGIGSAGVGKTYIPSVYFAQLYFKKKLSKLIVTRPTVECGKGLGALPGELDEKFEPWITEIKTIFQNQIGANKLECDTKNNNIEFVPLQFMRGRTLDNAGVIVDEAQNLTVEQAKMIITRIGINTKMVICGDTKQNDLKKERSGLEWLIKELRRQQIEGVDIIEFTHNDCQRSEMCKKMIKLINNSE